MEIRNKYKSLFAMMSLWPVAFASGKGQAGFPEGGTIFIKLTDAITVRHIESVLAHHKITWMYSSGGVITLTTTAAGDELKRILDSEAPQEMFPAMITNSKRYDSLELSMPRMQFVFNDPAIRLPFRAAKILDLARKKLGNLQLWEVDAAYSQRNYLREAPGGGTWVYVSGFDVFVTYKGTELRVQLLQGSGEPVLVSLERKD